MTGLVLTLTPGESVIINGAVIENGDRPARIRIKTVDARVLRCADEMRASEVNTPVKRIYFAVQLLITGELAPEQTVPAINAECVQLADVFLTINSGLIPTLVAMISRGNYYSALNHLRSLIAIEAQLLRSQSQSDDTDLARRVA